MATTDTINRALSQSDQTLKPTDRLEQLIDRIDIKGRIESILGKRSSVFSASILSLVKSSEQLQKCQPMTIIGAAMVAATLDLPINKNLGFAYIVPYKDEAQFQMGYKGFIQLAIRTGQYKTIHTTEIYADEIKLWNPLRAEIEFTDQDTWKQRENGESDKIVGYLSYFKLINGFEKTIYMTKKQILNHARRYSKSFEKENGLWKKDPHSMSLKTPLKLLLSKYGILSVEMQTALAADQAVIKSAMGEVPEHAYVDSFPGETVAEEKENDPPPLATGKSTAVISSITGKEIEL